MTQTKRMVGYGRMVVEYWNSLWEGSGKNENATWFIRIGRRVIYLERVIWRGSMTEYASLELYLSRPEKKLPTMNMPNDHYVSLGIVNSKNNYEARADFVSLVWEES